MDNPVTSTAANVAKTATTEVVKKSIFGHKKTARELVEKGRANKTAEVILNVYSQSNIAVKGKYASRLIRKYCEFFRCFYNGTIATAKMQNLVSNFPSLSTVGQVSGGLKCITSASKPTKDFTNRPMIAELTQGALDGSADVTSSKTTEHASLYKSSTISSNAILVKKVFDQPSANAVLNILCLLYTSDAADE